MSLYEPCNYATYRKVAFDAKLHGLCNYTTLKKS